jgi:hypothetical protein
MAKSIWEGRGGGAYNPLGPRAWAGLVHTRRSVIAHRVGERIDMTTRPAAIHLSSSPTIVSCASPRVTACREFAGPRDILAPAGGAVRPQWLRPGTAALGRGGGLASGRGSVCVWIEFGPSCVAAFVLFFPSFPSGPSLPPRQARRRPFRDGYRGRTPRAGLCGIWAPRPRTARQACEAPRSSLGLRRTRTVVAVKGEGTHAGLAATARR